MEVFRHFLLSEVCSRLSSGKSIPSNEILPEGTIPVYGGNGIRGYTNKDNFQGECAIIGRQGAFCGNVRKMKKERGNRGRTRCRKRTVDGRQITIA